MPYFISSSRMPCSERSRKRTRIFSSSINHTASFQASLYNYGFRPKNYKNHKSFFKKIIAYFCEYFMPNYFTLFSPVCLWLFSVPLYAVISSSVRSISPYGISTLPLKLKKIEQFSFYLILPADIPVYS